MAIFFSFRFMNFSSDLLFSAGVKASMSRSVFLWLFFLLLLLLLLLIAVTLMRCINERQQQQSPQ
jgi:hypothetical protein